MSDAVHIRYLQRHELNNVLWNECIDTATNGSIYAYTWYLDAMTDNWDGLVLNNYEAVMPLPWRKKYSIAYLYQPFLTAQGGVVGRHLTEDLLESFLQTIPKKFGYWEMPLNRGNLFPSSAFPLHTRMNYVLPLNKPYEALYSQYRENVRRNIKRSQRYNCSITKDVALHSIIQLAKLQAKEVDEKDFQNFAALFLQLQQQGKAKTYGVLSRQGELIASAVFLFSHKRAYYLLVGNHPNGRTLGASHALIDAFIRDHAGQNIMLDFEGSDISSLAFFYSSFGAVEETYSAIRLNRLPWWAKWLKQ